MGLLDDLKNEAVHPTTCRLRIIFDTLSDEEKEALRAALRNVELDERFGRSKQYSTTWLSSVLTNNGYSISRSTITRHLTGACSCEQPL